MAGTHQLSPNRWKALIFIALAQLMVVLDATVVNIALPWAQKDLDISDANRQWVVTAYALTFGGLLLFGGRLSDIWGRRRTFIVGLIGFAAASALGGAAVNEIMLLGARALQGIFGAFLAPAALSLLTVLFTDGKERAKAFGIFGAIAGGGGAIGLILGGALTEYLDWRWTFYVNIPFAVVAVFGAIAVISEPAEARNKAGLDIPGAVLATLGLVALVYGFTRAAEEGWGDTLTIVTFIASAVLLAVFVVVERVSRHALLPLRVVLDRNRGGVYLALGLSAIGMFGLFFFLTFYLQGVKEYSPVVTGVAFLPMVAAMIIGSTQIGARLMMKVPARLLIGPGFLLGAVAMFLLTNLDVDTSYAGLILPAMVLLGLGLGTAFMPAMSLATTGIEPRDAGVASAMVNTSQQVGGAVGTALLSTIAVNAATDYISSHAQSTPVAQQKLLQLQGTIEGYHAATWWAVGILVVSALLAIAFINSGPPAHVQGQADPNSDEAPVPVGMH